MISSRMLRDFSGILLACIVARNSEAAVRTVALTGQPIPGFASTTYGAISLVMGGYSLNNAGQVAFTGALVSSNGDAGGGILVEDHGSVRVAVQGGVPAPGAGPDRYLYPFGSFFAFNDSGEILVEANVHVDSTGATVLGEPAIYVASAGLLTRLAGTGDQAPGMEPDVRLGDGLPIHAVGDPLSRTLNDAGQTVFRSQVIGPGVTTANRFGIWVGAPGALELIVRTGDPAPRAGPGTVFQGVAIDFVRPAFNDNGQAAIHAYLTGSEVTSANNEGLWFWDGDQLEMLIREGDQAPGLPAGIAFGPMTNQSWTPLGPALNNRGQLVFVNELTGPGLEQPGVGVWLADTAANSLELIARRGDPAPGTGPDVYFAGVGVGLAINGTGEIAFVGAVDGPGVVPGSNSLGFWAGAPDSLRLVARAGDWAPGTALEVVFQEFGQTSPSLNARGQMMFLAKVTGPGVDETSDLGIWAETPDHDLRLIAREGDLLEVAPGDIREIVYLDQYYLFRSPGSEVSGRSMFNDKGQVAFVAQFADGARGVFVSDVVAVPEPHALLLAGIAIMIGVAGCRRRG